MPNEKTLHRFHAAFATGAGGAIAIFTPEAPEKDTGTAQPAVDAAGPLPRSGAHLQL